MDKVLTEATLGMLRVDGIKVRVCSRTGMFEQALCEVVASLFI